MTRDAAAQAVHERLEHLVAALPEPDVEAGWAALVTLLEPPVAAVVPLRRPRPRRALVLGVAAAVLIAGSALAIVRHGRDGEGPTPTHSTTTAPSHMGSGPRMHQPFSGPPAVHHADPPPAGDGHRDSVAGPSGSTSTGSSPDHLSDTHTGTTHHDPTHATHHDAADDTDHGTGNDGSHDDNGQGNDVQGQDTQGNGNGSSGGSGNDQGSGGGQGSGNRGTGSGGSNPSSGVGSNSGQASNGQGQGGGRGSDH